MTTMTTMAMMNTGRAAAVLLAVIGLPLTAAAGPESARRQKPIVLAVSGTTALAAVRLDGDVHAASADGYGDLRILTGADVDVPYMLRDVTVTDRGTVERTARAVVSAARPRPDGSLEIILTLGTAAGRTTPTAFRLLTPLHDFEHRVTIAWSADGGDWLPVVDEALIYDYERFLDVRTVTIPLPATPADRAGGRYRIVIGDVTRAQQSRLMELTRTLAGDAEREVRETTVVDRRPFRLDGIEYSYAATVDRRTVPLLEDHPAFEFSIVPESDRKATRIRIDTLRAPVSEIRIETASRNFSRAVRVEPAEIAASAADRGRLGGRSLGAGTITRIDVAGIRTEQTTLAVSEIRLPTLDLVIDDGDSPPIQVTGITTRGPARELVFLAEPGSDYRLAYGGDLSRPRYDTAAIRAAVAAGVAAVPATLGPESAGAAPAAAAFGLLTDSRFQIAIIALLAAILAAMLVRAARRLDASAQP
ncbi:MAG: hypothetical protein ACK6CT_14650, partial [Planctomycetia bacterium]